MSDSYAVQLTCRGTFSPVAYATHAGRSLPGKLRAFGKEWTDSSMNLDPNVEGSFATLVEALHSCYVRNAECIIGPDDGDGGAGVVLIELTEDGLKFTLHSGYLSLGIDGYPIQHADCSAGYCTQGRTPCPIWG